MWDQLTQCPGHRFSCCCCPLHLELLLFSVVEHHRCYSKSKSFKNPILAPSFSDRHGILIQRCTRPKSGTGYASWSSGQQGAHFNNAHERSRARITLTPRHAIQHATQESRILGGCRYSHLEHSHSYVPAPSTCWGTWLLGSGLAGSGCTALAP